MSDTPQTPNPQQEEQWRDAPKREERKESKREGLFGRFGEILAQGKAERLAERLTELQAENVLDDDDLFGQNPFLEIYDLQPAAPSVQREEGELFSLLEQGDFLKQEQAELARALGDEEQAIAIINEALEEYDENKARIASLEAEQEAQAEPMVAPQPSGGVFALYDAVADLGWQVHGYLRAILGLLKRGLLKPLLLLVPLFKLVRLAADTYLLKSVHAAGREWRDLRYELKNFRAQGKGGLAKAFVQALLRHRKLFAGAMNVLMPAAALALFAFTVNYWGSMTFALQVNYNNKNIGYIADESVYTQAQEMARERIEIGGAAENIAVEEMLDKAGYELKLITLNQLNDAPTICDRLIENSDQNLTNACGIYVDDAFICAVKNRADAENVFNSVLEPHQNKEKNSFAAFVEKVEYRPGLYPDDAQTMWDASQLAQRVNTPKSGEKNYIAVDGDTDYGIARAHGLTDRRFEELNPERGKYVHAGDKYIIASEVNFVQVKIMRTENRMTEIGYITETSNNSSMFQGDKRTVREGEPGQERVTELVTYVDGQRIGVSEISRTVVKEPVAAMVQVGTKSTKVTGYGGGTYNYSNKGFVWPAPRCTVISSHYGPRRMGYHTGVDLILPGGGSTGAVIVAAKSGVVEEARWAGGYGYCVVINHGDGYKTRYAHMQSGSMSVSAGQKVSAGQGIGRVGRTGNTTGPHLHFEVIYRGQQQNPMNYIKR